MKMHKAVVLSCLWGALFVGVSSSAAFVAHTIAKYDGVCEKLDGFPGLLQATGIVHFGRCAFVNGVCPGPTQEFCDAGGKAGHCSVRSIDGRNACVCIRN
jgi:hypothetical protein